MVLPEGMGLKELVKLFDEIYDEICIWDNNFTMVYINKACYRHYGVHPQDLMGKPLEDLVDKESYWTPTSVRYIYKEKKPVIQKQRSILGFDMVTISIPILGEDGEVKYVVQSVRDGEEILNKKLSPIRGNSKSEEIPRELFLCMDKKMKSLLGYTEKIAKTKAPVLVLGETGTGKSIMAKYIHEHSTRKSKPFVTINMASLSPSLIESELFGYRKGAFTGAAKEGKKGLMEVANGGTLFLDEIGEIPIELQAKFLHVIQNEEMLPIGGVTPIKLDIRIISATNRDLGAMVEAKMFREDLYHRLNVFELTIPPLSERSEDMLLLSSHFLNLFNEKYEKSLSFSSKVLEAFGRYPWKGNVRELSNVIEGSLLRCEGNEIQVTDLPGSFFAMGNKLVSPGRFSGEGFDSIMEDYEREVIREAYDKCGSSRKLAEHLKVSQSKANRLIQKYVGK